MDDKFPFFNLSSLIVFSLSHFVVDFSCAFITFHLITSHSAFDGNSSFCFFLYNSLAFGLEFLIGLLVSERSAWKCSCWGCFLLALGALWAIFFDAYSETTSIASFSNAFLASIILAGVGNALFHVGGGVDSLTFSGGKCWRSGVFISTGTFGIALGSVCAGTDGFSLWSVLGIDALCIAAIWKRAARSDKRVTAETGGNVESIDARQQVIGRVDWKICALSALLVVFIRSLVGFMAPQVLFDRANISVDGYFIIFAAFFGKALGGIGADVWGERKVGTAAFLFAIPAICFINSAFALTLGIFLLNASTSISLVATARAFPQRPGFAFGLTTLALLLGYFAVDPMLNAFDPGVDGLKTSRAIAVGLSLGTIAIFFATSRRTNMRRN